MTITFYGVIVVVHILAAIIGMGSTFASPIIMGAGNTTTTAKHAHKVNAKVEKSVKIGSFTLLGTGIILGIIHPYLFSQGWYITSIVLYIAVQPLVAYLIPKATKQQIELLESNKDEELSEGYHALTKKIGQFSGMAIFAIVVMVLMMSLKPF